MATPPSTWSVPTSVTPPGTGGVGAETARCGIPPAPVKVASQRMLPRIVGTSAIVKPPAGSVVAATKSVTRVGVFPYVDGAEPETTTEDAEALGIRNLLYRAETFSNIPAPSR